MTRAANGRKEKAKDKEVSATSYVSGRKADNGWTCVGRERVAWLVGLRARESGRERFGALQHDGGLFRE